MERQIGRNGLAKALLRDWGNRPGFPQRCLREEPEIKAIRLLHSATVAKLHDGSGCDRALREGSRGNA